MDAFRGAKAFKEINMTHSGRSTADGKAYDFEQGTPKGGVMGHLINALAELGDGKYKNLPDSVVRQRLINMAHYIPDMHCPAHIVFPENIHPSQKKMALHANGTPRHFHKFWDSSLGHEGRQAKMTYEKMTALIDVLSEEEIKAIQAGTLEDWSQDMIEMAHRLYEITPQGTDVGALTKEQKKEVFDIASKGVLFGAYRLAHIINTIFAE
jgi:hypothetical protein